MSLWLLLLALACLLCLLCLAAAMLVVSFWTLRWLEQTMEEYNVLFYGFNKQSRKTLARYGDLPIRRMYLVRQPFSAFITFLLNVCTLYKYTRLLEETRDNLPFHTLLVCEVELSPGRTKWVMVEKNNCINVSDNFLAHADQDTMLVRLPWPYPHKKAAKANKTNKPVQAWTLNRLLRRTERRMGSGLFFNWHLYTNNCQEFTLELLKTLGQHTEAHQAFVKRNQLMRLIVPSEFTLHVAQTLCVLYNVLEKYVYDTEWLSR